LINIIAIVAFSLHDPYKLRKLKFNLNAIEQAEFKCITHNQKSWFRVVFWNKIRIDSN
jgi:hypothetical protein